MFLRFLKNVRDDESGAVTVDWVVLAAATVVIGSTVISTIEPGARSGAMAISTVLMLATAN